MNTATESLRSGQSTSVPAASSIWRTGSAVAAAWFLSLGFDLFLHGGLLAKLYLSPAPFLLAPVDAFRRIPLGYLAFLILTISLAWLIDRLDLRGVAAGFRFGLASGAVVWGAFVVGLYSISTASLPLLAGWWVGQALELGIAGAVLGAFRDSAPLKRIWLLTIGGVFAFVLATILLQSLGIAPAMKTTPPPVGSTISR
jgi:hypothetical protein